MRAAVSILFLGCAAYCLDSLLGTFGQAQSDGQGATRAFLGLATVAFLLLLFRSIEKSRAADNHALDEHASATK